MLINLFQKEQCIQTLNSSLVGLYFLRVERCKENQRVAVINGVPEYVHKIPVRLYCEKIIKKISQLGLRYKIKRRIKGV